MVGFLSSPPELEASRVALGGTAASVAKGAIQFPLSQPILKALVVKMVKYRLSQLQE
jgi:hypothetical protein